MSTPTQREHSGGARAGTDPCASDRRLRGRTYAIPFEPVWTACVNLADGGLPRWRVVEADDEKGILEAVSESRFLHVEDDVYVCVGLDENGQTRVDIESASRGARIDLGRNARRIGAFFRRLDKLLGATPGQILDAAHTPNWTS